MNEMKIKWCGCRPIGYTGRIVNDAYEINHM